MTVHTFLALIVSFCEFKDPKVTRDYKELCMEHYVNCAIVKTGEIDLTKCKQYKGEKRK